MHVDIRVRDGHLDIAISQGAVDITRLDDSRAVRARRFADIIDRAVERAKAAINADIPAEQDTPVE